MVTETIDKSSRSQKTMDWSIVVFVNFLWATQVPMIRLIGERLGAITVAYLPMIVSTFIFIPFLWAENRKRGIGFRWRWKDLKYFIVTGFFGIFIMQYAYTVGSRLTLAANAGIITLTIPVLVAVCASFMLGEKLNIVRVLSFLIAIAGVLMTSVSDISEANFSQNQYLIGNLVFLFACSCCAFYNTFCKFLVEKKYTELEILVYGSIIGSIAAIPLLIWFEPFSLSGFLNSGKIAVLGILELSFFVYGLAMILFFFVLKRMDVTQAILGNYFLPFFIGLLGVLLLKESITLLMLIGGIIVFVSTLMVTVFEKDLLCFLTRIKHCIRKER